ncbi:MAG: heavy metal translocating P-type ATPase [Acutalibacteraceae bacterium]|nr:heavy metal translocating P-type ATPase [Acutalibacteraceae bacterium]
MEKQLFNVTGMTCAACSARVEKAVKHLDGVDYVSVNLLTNSMEVRFDGDVITKNDIIASVTKVGYGASLKNKAEEKKKEPQTALDEVKEGKRRLVASLIFLVPLFYITMGHMLGMPLPEFMHGTENALVYAFTQFLLTIPIVFINFRYFKNGFKNLFRLSPNMDSLIAIGSAAAIVYGIVAIYRIGWGLGHNDIELVKRYTMDLYFESAGTILTLITLGKLLESRAKRKTTDAITGLINLRPQTAVVIRNGNAEEIPIESVTEGDLVAVKAGSTIPVDGVIVNGNCTADESVITGESMPVEKSQGDNVIGATINISGYIEIKATKVGQNSTLSQIIALVEEASATKAPVAKIADKISGVFVPVVIAIAVVSAVVWLLLGAGVEFSLSTGIAVLVISCPCALGLATPTAIMTGTGRGAQMGVLIKSAEALESAGKINTVVLDKTGTITMGKPQVTDVIAVDSKDKLIDIAVSIESLSEHPLAGAVVEYGKSAGYTAVAVNEFKNYGGMGVSAVVNGTKIFAGNKKLMQSKNIDISAYSSQIDSLASDGKTPLVFASNNGVIGIIAVADVIKESSKQAVKELESMNIDVVMLTGDNTATANAIAKQCGIKNVIAEVMPQDKEAAVRNLQSESRFVAMVGDGINDAPALARADIGVAIGAGTDIAIDSADVVLVKSNLTDIVRLIQLSKKTMLNIKENLFWALIYNSIGIPLAAGAFYSLLGWKLNPMYGAAAMCVSSVCVVLNALRLRRFNPTFRYTQVENGKAEATVEVNTIQEKREEEKTMTKTIIINGMMCPHCSGAVEKALNAIDGVTATVDLASKSATVTGNVENGVLIKVITDAGYTVEEIK